MIELKDVTFTYPGETTPALYDFSFSARPGISLIVGPSGSGKSTLLRMVNGLVPHASGGSINGKAGVNGIDVFSSSVKDLARHAAFLFQDAEIQGVGTTVERDVAFGPENLGCTRAEISRRVDESLAACGVDHLRLRKLDTLSGGERQLVALAGAIAMNTPVLCLDEPLAQLDLDHRQKVIAICRRLAADGKTVIATEHSAEIWNGVDYVLTATAPAQNDAAVKQRTSSRRDAITWSMREAEISHDKRVILRNINLQGHRGEVIALTGANGSGKTTLLRAISGFAQLSAGERSVATNRCAYLPQNPASLLWRPSVRDEIQTTLSHRGGAGLEETLVRFGLQDVADRYPADLSSGQRQRAALATVLAGTPDLALLDEPTRGMDPKARRSLIESVDYLASQGGCVVIATHDRDLAGQLADIEITIEGTQARVRRAQAVAV
jgi:energy-coupling factor transport system ATP-binding protein